MTSEQCRRIVALSLLSRDASQKYGGMLCSVDLIDSATLIKSRESADVAYNALMAAINEATEKPKSNEWIVWPGIGIGL